MKEFRVIRTLEETKKHYDNNFLNMFIENDCRISIYEKLTGSNIYVYNNDNTLFINKKNSERITIIDQVLSNFYKSAISYLRSLNIKLFNKKYIYHIIYNPQNSNHNENNLVLVGLISRSDNKIINNDELIIKESNKLNISNKLPIVNNKLIEKSTEDIFNDKYIKSLIFDYNDDKQYIIKLKSNKNKIVFNLSRMDISVELDEIVKIIFMDILYFLKNNIYVLDNIKLTKYNKEEKYLECIYQMFCLFVSNSSRYDELFIKNQTIFNQLLFKINYDEIDNKQVFDFLYNRPNLEIILKYFIIIFRKKIKSTNYYFNEKSLIIQNNLYEIITRKITN